jgi:hypothetical protein
VIICINEDIAVGTNLIGYCSVENIIIVVNATVEFIFSPIILKVKKVEDKIRGQASQ